MESDSEDNSKSCDSWDDDPEIKEIKEMEKDLEMQIMKNIKKEKVISVDLPSNSTPVQLKVEVEVEQYSDKEDIDDPPANDDDDDDDDDGDDDGDGDDDDDDDDEEDISDNNITNIEELRGASNCNNYNRATSDVESLSKLNVYKKIKSFTAQVHISAEELIDAAKHHQVLDNYADKFLSVRVLNSLFRWNRKILEADFAERSIQVALDKWICWFRQCTRYSDVPQFYKCYMCDKAWWDLDPFREHLRKHKTDYIVNFEDLGYESNIVAYLSKELRPPFKNIRTQGKCLKCDRRCENHFFKANYSPIIPDKGDYPYFCLKCTEKFPTCGARRVHEQTQHGKQQFPCLYCKLSFSSKRILEDHLQRHTVRSDRPSTIPTKLCAECNLRYAVFKTHPCPKKWFRWCNQCYRQFDMKGAQEIHGLFSKTNVSCNICSQKFFSECSLVDHYLTHTNNFTLQYLCTRCGVFIHKDLRKQHKKQFHNRNPYYNKIPLVLPFIVPKALFLSKIEGLPGTKVQVLYVVETPPPPRVSKQQELKAALDGLKQDMYEHLSQYANTSQTTTPTRNCETTCIDLTESEPEQEINVKTEINIEPEECEDDIINLNINNISLMKTRATEQSTTEQNKEPELVLEKTNQITNEPGTFNIEILNVNNGTDSFEIQLKYDSESSLKQSQREKSVSHIEHNISSDEFASDSSNDEGTECTENGDVISVNKYRVKQPCVCTKCNTRYDTLESYLSHFTSHNYQSNTCPQCLSVFGTPMKLAWHFKTHINRTFLKTKFLDGDQKSEKLYRCKHCKQIFFKNEFFEHWESHFVLVRFKDSERYETALEVGKRSRTISESSMKTIIDCILNDEYLKSQKTCVVCMKEFNRQNVIKRHLIEHMLKDAQLKGEKNGDTNRIFNWCLRCQICSELLENSIVYKIHLREHASLPVHTCDVCDRVFNNTYYFAKHKKKHDLEKENSIKQLYEKQTEANPSAGRQVLESEPELNIKPEMPFEVIDEFEDDANVNDDMATPQRDEGMSVESSISSDVDKIKIEATTSIQDIKKEIVEEDLQVEMDYNEFSVVKLEYEDLIERKENSPSELAITAEENSSDSSLDEEIEYAEVEDLLNVKRKRHETRGRKPAVQIEPHLCTKCDKEYDSLYKYLEHLTCHDLKANTCPQCLKTFERTTKLMWHFKIHINQTFLKIKFLKTEEKAGKIFRCRHCKKIVTKDDFFEHWERHYALMDWKSQKKMDVVIVNTDKNNKNLSETMMKNIIDYILGDPKFKRQKICVVCKRTFNRQSDVKRHLVEHLLKDAQVNGERSFFNWSLRCQICSEAFDKASSYKSHLREHASLPIYTCELCDRVFSDSSNFTKHKKVHNLQNYRCEICNKKFQTLPYLEKHMEIHKEKPIKCPCCPVMSYTPSLNRRHIRMHHVKGTKTLCPICSERFHTLKMKWDHLWQVHKLRKEKWDCNLCGSSYRKFKDLKDHYKDVHRKKYLKLMSGNKKDKIKKLLLQANVTVKSEPAEESNEMVDIIN
ncbi:uncharacterized protein LOC114251675 [Bombyx mandarina]|uniref:Uncharacterized protein LOC114251675 n=1 Tax=Bombyx mandarina TaxID=7092 RepID=A0A6J2KNV2_BOMMA|nr:uncharacterized protein LOC114251675 [Bombyx mandarina]